MGMSEGTIVKWLKAVGDPVTEDEPLAEIEAEKTTEVIEAPSAGMADVWSAGDRQLEDAMAQGGGA